MTLHSLPITTLAGVLVIAGCTSGDSQELEQTGNIVIRNHGLEAAITLVNVVASDNNLNPDFESNLLDTPLPPGSSLTVSSERCGDPVDWRTFSDLNFVFARSGESFPCGSELDIFVNPDPFVAPESGRGILIFINNATEEGNNLVEVELRRSGIDGAVFGPGRLADDEVLFPGDEGDFDASPCNIAYDIRLSGVAGTLIKVLENTFIQCDFETEIELLDDDF